MANERKKILCPGCNETKEYSAKGMCFNCYRRLRWNRKKIVCKSCGRLRPMQAKGYCAGCYCRLFNYDNIKEYNAQKNYGIGLDEMRRITKECVVCGFNKIVSLHHLDGNKKNRDNKNLIGLCGNCHSMIHHYKYYEEIKDKLAKKGYDVSKVHPTNFVDDGRGSQTKLDS